jgi:hypothetical protein
MNLDDAQKQKVIGWIAEGLKLSDIQKRLETEGGVRLTYLEVRLLIDDLKLVPKDIDRPKPPAPALPAEASKPAAPAPGNPLKLGEPVPAGGKVSVTVDQLTRPGAVVSGSVTFSDGQKATWYLDQQGRLGLAAAQQGYRPSAADVQDFQVELQNQIQKMGF